MKIASISVCVCALMQIKDHFPHNRHDESERERLKWKEVDGEAHKKNYIILKSHAEIRGKGILSLCLFAVSHLWWKEERNCKKSIYLRIIISEFIFCVVSPVYWYYISFQLELLLSVAHTHTDKQRHGNLLKSHFFCPFSHLFVCEWLCFFFCGWKYPFSHHTHIKSSLLLFNIVIHTLIVQFESFT
jgi:hypothetical protein